MSRWDGVAIVQKIEASNPTDSQIEGMASQAKVTRYAEHLAAPTERNEKIEKMSGPGGPTHVAPNIYGALILHSMGASTSGPPIPSLGFNIGFSISS